MPQTAIVENKKKKKDSPETVSDPEVESIQKTEEGINVPNLPNFTAYIVHLDGNFAKVLDGTLREFNKIFVILPAGYNETFHFGQNKELYWDEFAVNTTQAISGYVYLGGEEFSGDWVPLFLNWYSSWWINWVQIQFDKTNINKFTETLNSLSDVLNQDIKEVVRSTYYMSIALKKTEEVKYLRTHFDQLLENLKIGEKKAAQIAKSIYEREQFILNVPNPKEPINWKWFIIGVAAIGVIGVITWTKYFGLW